MKTSNYISVKFQHPSHNTNAEKIIICYFPINPSTYVYILNPILQVTELVHCNITTISIKKRYGHTAHTFSRLMPNILLIWKRFTVFGGLVAQAVRRSPPTARVPISRLGPSMWVSWWTKLDLGRFFAGFLPFSPTTNFIPPFLHTHLIHFGPFQQPLWWYVRRGRPAPLLLTDL